MTRPAELLAQHEMFRSLPFQDRTFLAKRMYARTFRRGEVLITQGEAIDVILFVASGLVSVVQIDENGEQTELARLGDGTLVGEISLLTGNLPNATVTALIDSDVWALDRTDFDEVLQRSITLALSVNRMLSARLNYANQRLTPRRHGQFTAVLDETASGYPFVASLAERIAYYSHDPVVVIDGYLPSHSPFRRAPYPDVVLTDLLQGKSTLPYNPRTPEVLLVRACEDDRTPSDTSQILTLATFLRSTYRHIIFALPADNLALLGEILPLMDKTVVHFPRQRIGEGTLLLKQPEVAAIRDNSVVAISAWPTLPKAGDVWRAESSLGWNVAALISVHAPQQGIDAVARTIAKVRVGIAWGGGTARGWALAGIANALEQIGVPMDMFAGTSAGALGAAVYGLSLDYKEADARMRQILPYLKRTTRLIPPLTVSPHSLLRQSWWNDLIRTFVGDLTFDDMLIPYAAVALDLRTGGQKVFERGPLWSAIRASSAVPVIAPPMVIDGRPYSDGGVVNAVPLDVVATMGADILIGIDLTGRERADEDWGKDTTPNMIGTLTRTINVAYNTSASRTIPLAHVLVRPSLRPAAVYDVRVMDEFIAEGERATYAALPALKKVLKWL